MATGLDIKENSANAKDPVKFEIIEVTAFEKITEDEKNIVLKKAKKLAKDCCDGDVDHYDWIIKKFGTVSKNSDKIIYVYDKVKDNKGGKKFKKNYALGILIKKKAKFNLTGDGKIHKPIMCGTECNATGFPIWKAGTEIINIVVNEKDTILTDLKNQNFIKVKLCQTNHELTKLFFIFYLSAMYSVETFAINAYRNKDNFEFLTKGGCAELRISLRSESKVLLRLGGTIIETPVDCEYLNLGKLDHGDILMYPAIENFYIENDHLVTGNVKQYMKNLNCIYTKTLNASGFFYTVSAIYLQSLLIGFKGTNFSADYFTSLVEKSSSSDTFSSAFDNYYNKRFHEILKIFLNFE